MKFELIQAFIQVLLTCKNEENPIKSCHNISPIISSMGIFSDAPGHQLIRDFMDVTVTCKNEE